MKKVDVIRALKDKNYRSTLNVAQRSALDENLPGIADLDSRLLDSVAGGGDIANNGSDSSNWSGGCIQR